MKENGGIKMPIQVELKVSEEIAENYANEDEMKRSLSEDIIIREYQKGNIGIRQAARILGLTYEGFMKWLGEREISFISATKEELEQEEQKFRAIMQKPGK